MNAHTPQDLKISRKIQRSLSDAHSHSPLSYLELGQKGSPNLVFIHGFGADLLTWQLCLIPLMSRFHIIALDLPGHGHTASDVGDGSLKFMREWVIEALSVLHIDKAHLIGHSMGAKISLDIALAMAMNATKAPVEILSLSLISPAGFSPEFHHEALDTLLSQADEHALEAMVSSLLGPRGQNLKPSLTRSLKATIEDPLRRDALKLLLKTGQSELNGSIDFKRLACPYQIVWGDHDQIIPLPPNLHLRPHLIKGAGHLPHMEASTEVVALLKEFLA
jgi:pimeloyl-ACP methyl ester carboxylesterase